MAPASDQAMALPMGEGALGDGSDNLYDLRHPPFTDTGVLAQLNKWAGRVVDKIKALDREIMAPKGASTSVPPSPRRSSRRPPPSRRTRSNKLLKELRMPFGISTRTSTASSTRPSTSRSSPLIYWRAMLRINSTSKKPTSRRRWVMPRTSSSSSTT